MVAASGAKLKPVWRSGGATVGTWCAIPSSVPGEFLAAEGFDYVGVDCQHGLAGPDVLLPMLQGIGRQGVPAIVRVPVGSGWWVQRALDCGAEAVIVPMVNSAAEAAAVVRHCRYPPDGDRSYGPIRSELVIGTAPAEVNEAVACLVMIETVAGVEAADEICATPGVDGIYLGPADLAIGFGLAPRVGPVPGPHADAIDHVLAACKRHGIVAGIHAASGEQAREYIERGFQMMSISTDLAMLRSYARRQLRDARAPKDG
jgi:4-hydroxy-2-oxoheptanedioate aldolase